MSRSYWIVSAVLLLAAAIPVQAQVPPPSAAPPEQAAAASPTEIVGRVATHDDAAIGITVAVRATDR